MRRANSQSGFTLMEILVVVAIIGFLAVTILTALKSTRTKARDSQRKQALLNLQKALENYYGTNNSYPCSGNLGSCAGVSWRAIASGNCPSGQTVNTTGSSGYIPNLAPSFVGDLPIDPKVSTVQCSGFAYKSDGTDYKVISSNGSSSPQLGNGGPENTVPSTDQVYDFCRAGTAMAVSNNPRVTNSSSTVCANW